MHKPLVFLDIETTGGSHLNSRVLELGAIRVENGKVVRKMSQLIHPQETIPTFITQLTGINDRMVTSAPSFSEVAQDLLDMLEGSIFVAHNVSFDYNFIKMEFSRMGIKFNMDRLCTVRLSRVLYPEQRRHNLDTLITSHGFTVQDRHRALDDADVLWQFYQKALKEHDLRLYSAMNRVMTVAR